MAPSVDHPTLCIMPYKRAEYQDTKYLQYQVLNVEATNPRNRLRKTQHAGNISFQQTLDVKQTLHLGKLADASLTREN